MLRFLLDTHVFVRWVFEPRLSREQHRVLRDIENRFEDVGLATMSLLEMALLSGGPRPRLEAKLEDILEALRLNPTVQLLPITMEVAQEVAAVGDFLKDPMDRAIVATARVHRLTLLTSDQRIIESRLVPVID